ncbi:MAG: AbrB/MazE/SpoVT family DNA-binding domain-containing protein [FCB group bacterium]|jgi:antitoxin MazE
MKTKLIKIGNSYGVRIPKPLIIEYDLHDDIELEQSNNSIIIRKSEPEVRKDWDTAFKKMAKNKDDELIESESVFTDKFSREEWEW